MAAPSLIIIGAGVAGLSTGCYARMNGYATTIFEQHTIPGGLCTAWRREGYAIDGCVHWLMGSAPGSFLNQMWLELGALQGRRFVYANEYFRVEDRDGRVLVFHADLGQLGQHLKQLSPGDASLIDELVRGVRAVQDFDMPVDKAPEVQGLWDKARMWWKLLPILPTVHRWGQLSIGDFAGRFHDPLLREGIGATFVPSFPAMFMLFTLAGLDNRSSGYPIGGSLPFARAIEQRYLGLGGEVRYGSSVEKILVKQDRAVGVRLADGTEHFADWVVSAADLHATVFDLLDGRYIDAELRRTFEAFTPFPGLVLVGLGVNRSFESMAPSVSGLRFRLDEPMVVGGESSEWLNVRILNQDPTLAPPGKTAVTVGLKTDYEYWTKLRADRAAYEAEKQAVAAEVIRRLDRRFPGLAGQVEMVDVATPVTFHRYTRNWRGSFEGWLASPQNWLEHIRKSLPGLSRFYLAGQWVEVGGGLPPAAFSGRHVVQMLCQHDGKRFVARRAD